MDDVRKLLDSLHVKVDAVRAEIKKIDAPFDKVVEGYIVHPVYTPVIIVALAVLCLYVGAKLF